MLNDESQDVTVVISRIFFSIAPQKYQNFFIKVLNASYGARVRGNVFKIKFRVLAGEFESIETSPRFAQLLGENWNQNQ